MDWITSLFTDKNKMLYHAIIEENFEKVKAAIQKGADLNKEYPSNRPIFFSAASKNLEIFKYLLDNGLVLFIRSIGIKETDYVVVSTDGSPQIILCALQTPGFTEFHAGQHTVVTMEEWKKKGAKYFILIEKDIYNDICSELGKPVGKYKDVTIYKM